MAKVICPDCTSKAVSVSLVQGHKYYCPSCGWNADVARSALISDRKPMAVAGAFGLVLVALVFLKNQGDWGLTSLVATFFCGIPLAFLAQGEYQIRKLKGLVFQQVD